MENGAPDSTGSASPTMTAEARVDGGDAPNLDGAVPFETATESFRDVAELQEDGVYPTILIQRVRRRSSAR
jgi:hypothetical protein